jgi:hypothetical protein
MYAWDLNLIQRVHVTHTNLLSKIWYCDQTLPISRGYALQITMSILWFMWHGDIFWIPTSTLHCPKVEGELGLPHVHAKCPILFITRILLQCRKWGTVTAVWVATWRGYIQVANPPKRCSLAPVLEYLYPNFQGSAYLGPLGKDESVWTLKRRIRGAQLANLACFQKSAFYSGIRIFNSLPQILRMKRHDVK